MKYCLILLVSATATLISVNGKIPDYIEVCKRNNPEVSKCVERSINKLRGKLIAGIPEYDVPPIDPIHLDELSLNLGSGFKAEGRNLVLRGGKNFKINNLAVDLDANTYTFTVMVPEIFANGSYEIDAAIGAIPIKGKGQIYLTAKSVVGRGSLHGKKIERGGKTFYWFPSMKLKIDVADYSMKLEDTSEGDPTIGEVTNKVLNEEKTEILSAVLPGLEKALTEHILLAANNICKHFTWDELSPEN